MNELPHHHHENQIADNLGKELDRIDDFQSVADIFKLLDDTSRLRIFWLLCHTEECVINIAAMMDMTTPAVSHHLKLLKSSGLIVNRREGKEVYYKAAQTPAAQNLHEYIENIMEIVCPQ